ncbi:MAG: hypothetical protein FJ144_28455 [Deltaproteobacteria bacterium]|nr:hypothetical protein [Deltaproteobacteria bacterium]
MIHRTTLAVALRIALALLLLALALASDATAADPGAKCRNTIASRLKACLFTSHGATAFAYTVD